MLPVTAILLVTSIVQSTPSSPALADSWLQWGGPSRNFQVAGAPIGWKGAISAPRR